MMPSLANDRRGAAAGKHQRRGRLLLRRAMGCVLVLAFCLCGLCVLAAAQHGGTVTFGGLPVPGATVTATKGDKHVVAVTNDQGTYTFPDLEDGTWKFQVEMFGFETQTKEVDIAANAPDLTWELKLLPLDQITQGRTITVESPPVAGAPGTPNGAAPAAGSPSAAKPGGFQRANVNSTASAAATPPAQPPPPPSNDASQSSSGSNDLSQNAQPGLLVNGSVNNGAASAFSQAASFGNNRKGPGSLYNGGAGVIFDTSAWDAAPFSLTGLSTPKPSYNDVQIVSALGGPIGIPNHLVAHSTFFVAYQHAANDDSSTLPGLVPTLLQRSGNFSQTLNSTGQPVQIYNPLTHQPFAGNMIPVSPQAQALLHEYPLPNVSSGAYNYEAPVINALQQDSLQARATKNSGRNQFFGNFAFQRQAMQATDLFGFTDGTKSTGLDGAANWSRFFRPGGRSWFVFNLKYEFSRLGTDVTPFFANRANISGNAGILGNDQTPANWGPPELTFSSGLAGFSEPQFARDVNETQDFSPTALWYLDRHTLQFGGDIRRQQFNIRSQQDARGAFAFTGAATEGFSGGAAIPGTGSDVADFLLGVPDTIAISFGNANKYLREWTYDAFINDDWRLRPGLTLNAGIRWEHAQPATEVDDRLANLDVASGFTAVAPVVAGDPTGTSTGHTYPSSLVRSDFRGIEPRVGLAWRPKANSPLVIRAGYGVYDNTSVYSVIATQLAEQPPFTKTLNLQNSANLFTLANGFTAAPPNTPNTFAVDPNFRIGYVQNWQLSIQQDLPGALVMTATYLGTKGTRLMQEFLPNTFPPGGVNPCPSCPAGFVYLTSNGDSTRQAGQIQLRRRLSRGLAANIYYTYAKAIDDASEFSAAGLSTVTPASGGPATSTNSSTGPGTTTTGTSPTSSSSSVSASTAASPPSIAQNWLNLRAERGPSVFDQRHLVNFQLQYTSGEGLHGGGLLNGWRGLVLKDWTFTAQLTAGSGLPQTPVYLTNVTGTAFTGTIRPDLTGASVKAAPAGRFLNPAAYTAPPPGEWGNAGRDSIEGPHVFGLDSSISRTFRLNSRLDATWRIDATNVLNTVTYASWNTTFTSPLFGLPNQANTMRKLETVFRVRF